MPSGHKDSNPNRGENSGGGKKNVDGRENGAAYNKQTKPAFNPKHTFDPNEDAPQLNKGKDREGLQEGAY